jgi:hypothetical protein
MNTARETIPELLAHIRPALAGMLLAVLTLLFGFALGIVFGANEDAIKSRLKAMSRSKLRSINRGCMSSGHTFIPVEWAAPPLD